MPAPAWLRLAQYNLKTTSGVGKSISGVFYLHNLLGTLTKCCCPNIIKVPNERRMIYVRKKYLPRLWEVYGTLP